MGIASSTTFIIVHGATVGATAGATAPDEADTLRQVAEIGDVLTGLGARVEVLPLGLDLSPLVRLAQRRPAVVVNLVESLAGRGRLVHLVPAVLESLGLATTGCPARALATASDKPFAKQMMRAAGIATPDWLSSRDAPPRDGTWIVKSAWEHASIGLDAGSVVAAADVADGLAGRAARFGGDWFAERYIEGREFNVSLLAGPLGVARPEILPVAEMKFIDFPDGAPRIVDYAAKWDESSDAYRNTVRDFDLPNGDAALLAELVRLSRACWCCFGLAGYARVDFRVDAAGRPWVLEVNANPCLSSDAGFMAAADRAGLTQEQVVMRLLGAAGVFVSAAESCLTA
jgi:D-alanine-D-alanine ligase